MVIGLTLIFWACSNGDAPSRSGTGKKCTTDYQCLNGQFCHEGFCQNHCSRLVEGCPSSKKCDQESGLCLEVVGCTQDSDCILKGQICQGGICVFNCEAQQCGSGEKCDPASGKCLKDETTSEPKCPLGSVCKCTTDQNCHPPKTICENLLCEPGCSQGSCGIGRECDLTSGRCYPNNYCNTDKDCLVDYNCYTKGGFNDPNSRCLPSCSLTGCATGVCGQDGRCEGQGCTTDQECNPPYTICQNNSCANGCLNSSCPTGKTCNQASGRCLETGIKNLGQDCTTHQECSSETCLRLAVMQQEYAICTKSCCHENECPSNFGCILHNGLNFCLPERIFPPSIKFTTPAGGACSAQQNHCKSNICDTNKNRCLASCCTNSNCSGLQCIWSQIGISTTARLLNLCNIPLGYGSTGSSCTSQMDCASQTCVRWQGGGSGFCGDLCCYDGDCPAGFSCSQISGLNRSFTMACVKEVGTKDYGQPCSIVNSQECKSGLCYKGKCVKACCQDSHCPTGFKCLPTPNEESPSNWVNLCLENK